MICPWCEKDVPDGRKFCPYCKVELNPSEGETDFVSEEEPVLLGCLRCDGQMHSLGVQKIQLGQTGWLFGDLPNLLSGALQVEIFQCDKCGKLEFFSARER